MSEYVIYDAKLYSSYMLTSNLITNPKTSSSGAAQNIVSMNYDLDSYKMEDYSEITDDAIAAYQAEVDKGTINNPDIIKSNLLYNNVINAKPNDLTSVNYGLSGPQIIQFMDLYSQMSKIEEEYA